MFPMNNKNWYSGIPFDLMSQREIEKLTDGIMALPHPIRKRITQSWLRRIGGGLVTGVVVATVMLSLIWLVFRRYKTKQSNTRNESRFDFIDDVSHTMNTNTDFDHASLDELEDALLKVENQLAKRSEVDPSLQ